MMVNKRYQTTPFASARLVILDFDRTIANTFAPSPNGVDVSRAYVMAIEKTFGPKLLEKYIKEGGLRGRDPSGVIDSLMPDASVSERLMAAALLVQAKLDILLDEICPNWPLPMGGFVAFWRALQHSRQEGMPINTALVTSGHDSFTRRTFETWGLPRLEEIDIYITYDMVLALADAPHQDLIKPAPFLMDFARKRWCLLHGVTDRTVFEEARSRIFFIGDDIASDGLMVSKAGVDFTHTVPDDPERAWHILRAKLGISS